MNNIHIIKGDITKARVDVIVNAANPVMLGGGGVDRAIHHAAGPMLVKACRAYEPEDGMRCPPGEARSTTGFNLNCNFIFHTVGPKYEECNTPEKILESCYVWCLDMAIQRHCRSIAFPAISCGVYGYPPEEAARISLDVCSDEIYKNIEIYFYLYSDRLYRIWADRLDIIEGM